MLVKKLWEGTYVHNFINQITSVCHFGQICSFCMDGIPCSVLEMRPQMWIHTCFHNLVKQEISSLGNLQKWCDAIMSTWSRFSKDYLKTWGCLSGVHSEVLHECIFWWKSLESFFHYCKHHHILSQSDQRMVVCLTVLLTLACFISSSAISMRFFLKATTRLPLKLVSSREEDIMQSEQGSCVAYHLTEKETTTEWVCICYIWMHKPFFPDSESLSNFCRQCCWWSSAWGMSLLFSRALSKALLEFS